MIKLFSIILCIIVLFSSCSFEKEYKKNAIYTTNSNNQYNTIIKLPFNSTDSLNPYTLKSPMNKNIMPLIYDGLIKIDDQYNVQNIILEKIIYKDTTVSIFIKSNCLFSDGSIITIKDVYESLNLAFKSNTYSNGLKNISNFNIVSKDQIDIILKKADIMFEYLLDFPIIKFDSLNSKYPIGSGRFFIEEYQSNIYLNPNNNNPFYKELLLQLIHFENQDNAIFSINTNQVSILNLEFLNTNLNSIKYNHIPTNNIVYLGLNKDNYILSNPEFRTALSNSINRSDIVSNGFANNAIESHLPFNPMLTKNIKKPEVDNNLINNFLDKIGLSKKYISGFRKQKNSDDFIVIDILINNENAFKYLTANIIKSTLNNIGIKSNIIQKDFNEYSKDIKSGNYDMYIGETKLYNNMDISSLFENKDISNFFDISSSLKNSYENFKLSKTNFNSFINEFSTQYPFIPLLFKYDIIISNNKNSFNIIASINDIYYNINNWN